MLDFVIPPNCVPAGWFLAACAAGAGASICWVWWLWWVWRPRARRVATSMRRLRHERQAERDRFAHERHDALLQSTQGLILSFHAATDRMPSDDPTRAALAQVLDRAEDVLRQELDRMSAARQRPRSHDRVSDG
jgi:signal transduction histidine kinase